MGSPRVVIIGAGIVGTNLADELTARGWDRVTVLDQGPLPLTGGSSSHAPGLVFQTNPSKTMTEFATYTVEKFLSLDVDGQWCFNQVGGLEVATTEQRLSRTAPQAGLGDGVGRQGSGPRSAGMREAASAARPQPDPRRLPHRNRRARQVREGLRGTHSPRAGPRRGVPWFHQGRRRRAQRREGHRRNHHRTARCPPTSSSPAADSGAPISAHSSGWTFRCCRWPISTSRHIQIPELAGRNTEISEAGLPILRHQDRDLYFREHVDRLGIGSYAHRPMPVDMARAARRRDHRRRDALDAGVHRRRLRPGMGAEQAAAALPADGDDRIGFQRHLLVHPGRRAAGRRITRRRRLLDRRSGVGDALRRRGPRGGTGADRRPVRDRAATAATCTGSKRCNSTPATSARRHSRTSSRSTTSCIRCSPRNLPAICASVRSMRGRRNSGRCSSRRPAGRGRTGSRPTPRWSTSYPPNGSRPHVTNGRACSTRPSPPPRRGAPGPRWRFTT